MAGKTRVVLVDDSAVVRGLVQRALSTEPTIEIVGSAVDGQMALDLLKRTPTDIVILDIEMPVMDGLTALPEILKISPKTRVIMASTLTLRNAEISLKAMELGASDYVAKPTAKDSGEVDEFYRQLIQKIKALSPVSVAPAEVRSAAASPAATIRPPLQGLPPAPAVPVRQSTVPVSAGALAIASSTGGPQALIQVFKELRGKMPRVPVFITQHMPPNFTTILADHISKASGFDCHEAKDGEEVRPGIVYLAPGDFHMSVERSGTQVRLKLDKNPQENFCRPSADPMLRSLARVYGKQLLVTVLTGLGSDGSKGSAEVVAAGGTVIAQDEASCVVYGMPRAVVEAKLTSAVFSLTQIPTYLAKAIS